MKSFSAIDQRKTAAMLAVLLSSTCLTIASAWAQDATWTGATSTDWNTGSNWSTGSTPTGTATFPGSLPGSTPHLITFSQSTTIGEIRFSAAADPYQFSQVKNLQIVGAGISGVPDPFFSSRADFDVDQPAASMSFRNSSTAGEATIEARRGGTIRFFDTSTGGSASLFAVAGGAVDISTLTSKGMSAGALGGDGIIYLGSKNLTLNGVSGSAGGIGDDGFIADGGQAGGTGGSLTINSAFTMSGANTYTGGTTIGPTGTLALGNGGTRGSILGDVVNNGILLFNRTDLQTFSGVISGAGRVEFGNGTVILTGNNTYTGGSINFGAFLQIGDGGTTGSIIGDIRNDGTFAIRRSDTYVFAGVISGPLDTSGTGNFQQLGTGKTILTGANTYTGTTTVHAGTLSVDGSIALSRLTTVNAGGTLGGNGTVGNTTINGGTLAPGNSIGTLTVQGNLVFTAAASYMVEVSPANADRTNVMGTAALGGAAVKANFAPGTYVAKQYTIVNATGGVIGTLGGPVNSNLPAGFQASLSYDANNAYLDLALFAGPNFGTGLNVNQTNVANALTGFFNRTGGIPIGFGALTPGGLTIVSGELPTAAQQTTFNAMNLFLGLLADPFVAGRGDPVTSSKTAPHFADENDAATAYASNGNPRLKSERDAYATFYRKAPILADPALQRWSVWAAAYGGSQTTDGNTVLGSNNTRASIGGVVAGADYRFSPNTLAGFALAGGGTSFNVSGLGSGRSDLFQAGSFLRHTFGPAYLTAALAYGWQDITTVRNLAGADVLRASFNANAFSGRVEGGYRFVTPWMAMGITSYAAGQFTTFELPAYAEQVIAGTNAFALAYGARDVTASRSELGLRSDKSYAMQNGIFTLRGRVAWAHDFNTDRNVDATFQTLPGATFVVNGAAQASDAALLTVSAEMKWLNGFSLAGTFEGEFSNVTTSYAGKVVARYVW